MSWYILSAFSAIFSAASAVFEKKLLFTARSYVLALWAAVLGAVVAIPVAQYFGRWLEGAGFLGVNQLSLSVWLVISMKSLLAAIAYWLVLEGMKRLEISAALPLMVLTPGLVALLEWMFLAQRWQAVDLLGMGLLLLGTLILQVRGRTKAGRRNYWPIVAALVLMGFSTFLDKLVLGGYRVSPFTFLALQHLLFIAFYLFVAVLRPTLLSGFGQLFKEYWPWLLGLALLTIAYRLTQILAIQLAPAALVLALKRFSVLLAALVGGRLFKEGHLLPKLAATAIMLLGAFLLAHSW